MITINLSNIKALATSSFGRTGLILAKKSPEIFLGLGIVAGVGCVVLACKATLKVEEILEEGKETIDVIKHVREQQDSNNEEYSEEDMKKDMALTYIKTGAAVAKLYMPAIGVGLLAIGLIYGSHHILSKRNIALAAAYKAVDLGFKNYRERVRQELGDDADARYRYGETTIEEITKGKNAGTKKISTVLGNVHDGTLQPSIYACYFDERCPSFQRSYDMNSFFLRSQENYANDMLNSRGHVFLNEIYDMIGVDRTSTGAIVGWIKGQGDDFIDFGLLNPVNEQDHKYDPINAGQPIFLDFNVQGNIYDLIS